MKFQAIKGVRDILPTESALWSRVEQSAREVFHTYGYGEIRLPIFEQVELFARSIGQETDVVSKEMYRFEDYELVDLDAERRSLALRHPQIENPSSVYTFFTVAEAVISLLQQSLITGQGSRRAENGGLSRGRKGLYDEDAAEICLPKY